MDYSSLNKFQTEINPILKDSLPQEVWADLIDYIDNVPFINWLVQPESIRGYAKDRVKHNQLDDADERKQYDDGRIVVDITKPHILEDMDFFRERALYFDKYGVYTHLTPNPNPNGDYALFWKEEKRRWKDGLIRPSDGEWIPGGLYFYWNYTPIWQTKTTSVVVKGKSKLKGERVRDFPKPWLGDYLFYHYMEQGRENGEHGNCLKCRGVGMEQPHSEVVKTPQGDRFVGDIRVGDYLIGIDGKPTKVLEVYPQGVKDVYEVTLLDGRTVRCGINHLWYVKDLSKRKVHPVRLQDMISTGLTWNINGGKNVAYRYKIPKLSPVEYPEKEYSIPPYVLGALLGDGTLTTTSLKLATDDIEMVEEFERLLPEYKLVRDHSNNNYIITDSRRFEKNTYNKKYHNSKFGINKLKRDIDDLGLNVKCFDKFIPEEYLLGSIEQRMELLKGLMDSDGSVSPTGSMEFANSNYRLITQVATLCRSLGIKARLGLGRPARKKDIFGSLCNIQQEYRLYISTNEVIFKLPRKVNRCRKKSTFNEYPIVDIKKLDYQEESSCFLVDNATHTYLTRDYVPTHNSFKLSSLSPRNMYVFEGSGNPNFHLASDKTYLQGDKGIFGKIVDNLDWIGDNTPMPRLRLSNGLKAMEIQLGYADEYGARRGLLSSVFCISLKDNPDKARGIRGPLVHYEELGMFANSEDAWNVNRKAVEDGDVAFGYMLGSGTANVDATDFEGLKKMFYGPKAYNIYALPNVYDKNSAGSSCAYFWGSYLNRKDCYEEVNGEPDVVKALVQILKDRHKVKYSAQDPRALTIKKAEEPITPAECIVKIGNNTFPIEDIKNRLAEILPNQANFVSSHYIGDLVINGSGDVEWKISNDKTPIREFPYNSEDKRGGIEIYKMPSSYSDGTIPKLRYIAGCLPPGEKVMTSEGLVNAEDVDFNTLLINEVGNLVPVKRLYKLYKDNEDVYEIKMSNCFRTTKFTSEHPILSCTPKLNYHNSATCKRNGVPQRVRTYNFEYKPVKDIKVGDYVKIPNIYKKEIDGFEKYWKSTARVDRKLDNPLLNPEFWWFIGVWLGDGWTTKGLTTIAFNAKETIYIERCCKIITNVFKRKAAVRTIGNCINVSFCNYELAEFLETHFGKYAIGKKVPEWAKYMPKKYKLELVSGYLASDGCINMFTKRGISTEFVSINLELLESFQDILFSLGIISALKKLRGEKIHWICGKPHPTKDTYSLVAAHDETLKLGEMLNWYDSHKLGKLTTIESKGYPEKTALNCFFADDTDYIYVKIKDITQTKYTGYVYNYECETHTYMCRMITTHNCDPVDDDEGTSLCSVFVFDRWTREIVAEYTGRPNTADEFYEICHRLAKFYNGIIMYENNKKGMFTYFRNKNLLHWLADVPNIISDKVVTKVENALSNKTKGFPAVSRELLAYLRKQQAKWMNEPILDENGEATGLTKLHTIRSIAYLQECATYNDDGNFDRISAMNCIMIYDLELGNVEINRSMDQTKSRAADPFFSRFYKGR